MGEDGSPTPCELVGELPQHDEQCLTSQFHLLLELSRRFTTAPRLDDLIAEGFALTHAGLDVHLPHARVPTWDDAPGRAYVGIPVADPRLWPVEGGDLLQDFDRTLPLLRNGFPEGLSNALVSW